VSRSQRGYTLLELAIVLSFAGILAAVGANNLRLALDREQVDGWTRSIAYDIAAGQQAAITRRASVTTTFLNQTYSISVAGGGTLRRDRVPTRITFGGTEQAFTYDRRGVPSSAFSLTIRSTSTGRSYLVSVAPGTGRVTFGEYGVTVSVQQ
jgi:prepilin-type N-terminal cleavage/methylation domain-containing protein